MLRALLFFSLISTLGFAEESAVVAKIDEFPQPGSAQRLSGELTMVDHINRMGILRPDRSDKHNKYHWDLPHHFTLLPYGVVYRCGSPATLRDVPLGTHLHGDFLLGPKGQYQVPLLHTEYAQKVANDPNEFSPDSQLSHVLRLADDFTLYQRQGAIWKVVSIDLECHQLELERIDSQPPPENPVGLTGKQTFDFTEATRFWLSDGFADLSNLTAGEEVLFNLEWATLYGPGRLTDVWIDAESRALATERQHRSYLQQMRDRGFPARIDHVEHLGAGKGEVTFSFYQGPTDKDFALFLPNTSGRLAVVESNLRTYHDAALGIRYLEFQKIENPPPGHGGVTGKFSVGELLEGIRPGRTVRIFPSGWLPKVLPREERLAPFDIRPRFLEVSPEAD